MHRFFSLAGSLLLVVGPLSGLAVAQTTRSLKAAGPASNGSADRARPAATDPSVEAIDVEGAERTRPAVVLDALRLRPQRVLTPDAFARAARRLDALPAASRTELSQRPLTNGSVRVTASIKERALVPTALGDWALVGGRALFAGDIKFDVSGPFGAGEVFSTTLRWSENRPKVGVAVAVPQLGPLPGVTRFEGLWERQAYARPVDASTPFRERRLRAGIRVTDWAASWVAWHAGAAFDRFGEADHVAVNAGLDVRLRRNLVAIMLDTENWSPTNGGSRFFETELAGAWRSTAAATAPWQALAGVTIVSNPAPLALWPGASAGRGRGVLLRAHPLHDDGIVTSDVFGRRMLYGSIERQQIVKTTSIATFGVAGFVDAAKAWRGVNASGSSPVHVDIGVGLRINALKTDGMVRLDFGYGLQDGNTQLSAGWVAAWPRR